MNGETRRARLRPWRQAVKRGLSRLAPPSIFIERGPVGTPTVALTFDDGPHPEHTPRLLDVMRQLGVRATFFLVGRQMAAHPDIVRRIAEEGHALGHHSFHHGDPALVTAQQIVAEVLVTDALFREITGRERRLFRPPHGKLTVAKLLHLGLGGRPIVLWNVDPKDYACARSEEVASFFRDEGLAGGDIVLMHDTHPHAPAVLPELVARARGQGLRFDTVEPWIAGP